MKTSTALTPAVYRVFALWPEFYNGKSISSAMPRDAAEHLAATLNEQGAQASIVEETMPDPEVISAQAARIRDLVSDNCQLTAEAGAARERVAALESTIAGLRKDLAGQVKIAEELRTGNGIAQDYCATRCFFALALGYFGRGATLEEALINLQKAGCNNMLPIAVDLFIGDDKPTVINGGLNIEYKHTATRIRIGLFKSLGAALRNLREP